MGLGVRANRDLWLARAAITRIFASIASRSTPSAGVFRCSRKLLLPISAAFGLGRIVSPCRPSGPLMSDRIGQPSRIRK
jgi:hypothetical protein